MESWWATSGVELALVIVAIVVFAKICSWAKTLKLPGKVKLWTYIILLGIGTVAFNVMYSQAGTLDEPNAQMPIALGVAFIASIIYGIVLMAEVKEE